ncbi:hypothetical protein AgCh_014177 [Apium graveolens]
MVRLIDLELFTYEEAYDAILRIGSAIRGRGVNPSRLAVGYVRDLLFVPNSTRNYVITNMFPLASMTIAKSCDFCENSDSVVRVNVCYVFAEIKPAQASSMSITKTFENSASFNLRPPPVDRHKSFDEDDLSVRPITAKKVNTTLINAISYSIADLQIATNIFNVEDLIGEGSTGRVYRAQFDDGRALNHNAGSGYSAPEVAMSAQYTIKSDIYSFGVSMLELLSGRKPFDSSEPMSDPIFLAVHAKLAYYVVREA